MIMTKLEPYTIICYRYSYICHRYLPIYYCIGIYIIYCPNTHEWEQFMEFPITHNLPLLLLIIPKLIISSHFVIGQTVNILIISNFEIRLGSRDPAGKITCPLENKMCQCFRNPWETDALGNLVGYPKFQIHRLEEFPCRNSRVQDITLSVLNKIDTYLTS